MLDPVADIRVPAEAQPVGRGPVLERRRDRIGEIPEPVGGQLGDQGVAVAEMVAGRRMRHLEGPGQAPQRDRVLALRLEDPARLFEQGPAQIPVVVRTLAGHLDTA